MRQIFTNLERPAMSPGSGVKGDRLFGGTLPVKLFEIMEMLINISAEMMLYVWITFIESHIY